MDIGILTAVFKANTAEFIRDVGKAAYALEQTEKRVSRAMKTMNNALQTTIAGVGVGAFFKKMYDEASQAEAATKKVAAILKATGGAAGVTAQQVDDLADAYSKLSGVDDDVIKDAEAMLLTFKGIGKDVFPRATQAILDVSQAMGQDLNSAAITVGKALDNPIAGMTALQKQGLGFSESQKAVIKQLEQTGHHAEAAGKILDALEGQIGGVAAAARDSMEGAMKALDTAIGNLFETMGSGKPMEQFRYAIEFTIVSLQHFTDWLKESKSLYSDFAKGLEPVAQLMIAITKPVGNAWTALVQTTKEAIIATLESANQLAKGNFNPEVYKSIWSEYQKFADEAVKTDWMGALGEEIKGLAQETDFNMIKMKQAAQKAGPGIKQGLEDGFSPLKKEKLDKQLKDLEDFFKGVWKIQAETRKFQEQTRQIELDTADILAGVKKPSAQELRESKELWDEKIARDKILDDLADEIELKKAEIALNGKLQVQLEAQKQLAGMFVSEGAKGAEEYKKSLESLIAALEEKHNLESVDEWNKRKKAMQEETLALEEKVKGTSELVKSQKMLNDLEKEQFLTKEQKLKYAGEIQKEIDKQEALNKKLKEQKELYDRVGGSTLNYRQKLAELDKALKDQLITVEQYDEQLKKLNNNTLKSVQKSVTQTTTSLLDGLTNAITSGQKLTDVFKQMGLQFAKLGVQKFLVQPLANAAGNYAQNFFKNNVLPSAPGVASTGGGLAGALLRRIYGTQNGKAPSGVAAAQPTGQGQSALASGGTPGLASIGGGLAGPIGLTGSAASTQQFEFLHGIASNLNLVTATTVEGPAIRVKVAREAVPKLPGGKPIKAVGSADHPDNIIPFLKTIVGVSKAGPAWRVIEPDCPCPTLAGVGKNVLGLPSKAGGLLDSAKAGAKAGSAAQDDALQSILGILGLSGLMTALKGLTDKPIDIAGIIGQLSQITQLTELILRAMCPCNPAPPPCSCGPGGAGGGYSGSGPGGFGGGGLLGPGGLGMLSPQYDNSSIPGVAPTFLSGMASGVGGYGNAINEANRAAHDAAANAAQRAVMSKPANQYLTPQQTITQYNNAQYADQMRLRNISAANAWGPATGNLVMQQQANWQTAMNTLNAQATAGQLWGYTSDYFKSDPNSYTKPFVMQGNPYAGATDEFSRIGAEQNFVPGLTGALNNVPVFNPYNGGDYTTQQGGMLGPYGNRDAHSAYIPGALPMPAETVNRSRETSGPKLVPYIDYIPAEDFKRYGWGQNAATMGDARSMSLRNRATFGIHGYADGGVAPAGKPVWVGERGKELAVFGQDAHIIPNAQAQALSSGGSGLAAPNVMITNNGHPIQVTSSEWDGRTMKATVENIVANAPNNPGYQRSAKRANGAAIRARRTG